MFHRFLLLCCGAALLFPAGCTRKPPPGAPPTPEVTVSLPVPKKVTDYEIFTGRTDAIYTVDVKARVNGYLDKVYFKDGDMVKKDQKLYLIDPRPYQADLDKAKGQVERLEGQKKLLEIQVDRYTKLVKKGAASQQELDVYIGQQAENTGSLAAAKSQVEYSKLYLDFCTVTAPIDGQISRTYVQIGNVIAADQTLLTTIVSVNPMYAYFNVEETTYLRVKALMTAGLIKSAQNVKVQMGLANDVQRKFPFAGKLDFFNNIVNPLTGTIEIRGVFDNPDGTLKPGLFTRVKIPVGVEYEGLLVAEQAIGTDQGEKFVYVVDKDNKVQYRRVTLGLMFDGLRAIKAGIESDDRIIVNGLQRVRPDIEVRTGEPVPMTSLVTTGKEGKPAAVPPRDEKTAPR